MAMTTDVVAKTESPLNWHQLPVEATVQHLGTSLSTGLESAKAVALQGEYGTNELIESAGRSPLRIVVGTVHRHHGADLDRGRRGLWLFLQSGRRPSPSSPSSSCLRCLGFMQEYRAERAMAALKKLAVPNVRVRRDGQVKEISAKELVPGDVVLLEAGNLVPADLRLIESGQSAHPGSRR